MAELTLALLGPPLVEVDGARAAFDTRKAVALLALLAVTGREHGREQLATMFWPDADGPRARGSLRRTLSVTAAATGDCLNVTRTAVRIPPARLQLDVADFTRLRRRGDAASLRRAALLYRDDFLAGFSLRDSPAFEDWQLSVADGLRGDLAGVLAQLVSTCVASGDLAGALSHARRWLSLDPLHEPAHQALIRLHAWTGQRSAALRQYRDLVRILDREIAVRPLPETTRLYDDVRAGRLPPAPSRTTLTDAQARQGTSGASRTLKARKAPETPEAPEAPAWPLVGRAAELQVLSDAWQAAGQGLPAGRGAGRAVAIVGEAGSGKTSLAEAFRAQAESAGAITLTGRCHDGESGLPFALAADLLRAAVQASAGLPGRLPGHVAVMAGRLAPELAASHQAEPAPPLSSPVALTRLYAAIGATLAEAVQQDGSKLAGIVVVEDAHWADRPSIDLLAYLLRRLAGWPLLLILTWRPEQAERLHGLRAALGEAAGAGSGSLLEPGALTAAQIATELATAGMPEAAAGRLFAETRGVPMLVREYAEALRAAGEQPGAGEGEDWPTPAAVRGLMHQRLRAASEPARQMLSTAAVLGSGCDADLLRAVSGRGEAETVEALDEAIARFLLTEVPPAGERGAPGYAFPYEPLRRVAYSSATLARRRLLHSRAADALARRHERDPMTNRAATIAEHLQQAGRDAEAAGWWWQAAQRARELYAHAEAYAHLRKAIALGYPPVPGAIAVGDVLTVLGRYHEALAEYERAAAGSDGDDASAAAIEHKLAEVRHRLGDWALADAHLTAALDLLPGDDLGGRARAEADRAVVAYRRGAMGQADGLGQSALEAARRAADPAAIAQALNVLGMVAAREGDQATAEEYLRESLAQARGLPEPGAAVAALNNLARLLADAGRGRDALPLATEALALGSELGDQHRVAALHTNLADLLHATGDADGALGHLKEAARRFAAVDPGAPPRPEIWMLVDW